MVFSSESMLHNEFVSLLEVIDADVIFGITVWSVSISTAAVATSYHSLDILDSPYDEQP